MTMEERVEQRAATRRQVLLGASGVVAGGVLAMAGPVRGLSVRAQDASPAAGTDVSALPEVVYAGAEYSFTGPAEIPGGLTRLTLRNDGQMDHHAIFFMFNEGKSVADLASAMQGGLEALFALGTAVGGPGSIASGEQSTVIQDLAPGNYIILCLIPDTDGIPHAAKGMALPVTVTAATGAASPPTAEATVDLLDFSFSGIPASATPGEHVWQVMNSGQQLHELVVFQLAPGVTIEQLQEMLAAFEATPEAGSMDMASPMAMGAPFTSVTGWAPASPGASGWVVLDLEAGDYVAICFVPDAASGAPHFALGMIAPFTVA